MSEKLTSPVTRASGGSDVVRVRHPVCRRIATLPSTWKIIHFDHVAGKGGTHPAHGEARGRGWALALISGTSAKSHLKAGDDCPGHGRKRKQRMRGKNKMERS